MPDPQEENHQNHKARDYKKTSSEFSGKEAGNSGDAQEKKRNPIVQAFAKTGYAIWISVMVIGGILAFIISLVAI
ncbi:hypothetical protein [Autumnicola musiva]|uniref:Uncharacterized protein n=1 Tax=Autumnicola musiva TaxID=3075589 RepID=A0ABU3D5I9_9FLAO|nr:hypothetical protein [Zunongwangia sp. F117]MDT0676764.1 hypothetical protein [Zunongwangia sp. F117]